MKQDDPQFKLRIPPSLKEKLEEAAKSKTRTLGAEMVARLEASFDEGPNEFADWERYKRELLLRARIEHARTQAGVFAMSYLNLWKVTQDGTWANMRGEIDEVAVQAQKHLDELKDGVWEKLLAEHEVVQAKRDALKGAITELIKDEISSKKPTRPRVKKG